MSFLNYIKGVIGVGEAGQERRRTNYMENNSMQAYIKTQSRTGSYKNLGIKELDGEELYLQTMLERKKMRTEQFTKYDARGKEAPEKEAVLPSVVLHQHHVEQLEMQKGLGELLRDNKDMDHNLHNQLQKVADKAIPEYFKEVAKNDKDDKDHQPEHMQVKEHKDKDAGKADVGMALNAAQGSIDKGGLDRGATGIDKQKAGDAKDSKGDKVGTHKLTVDDKSKDSKKEKDPVLVKGKDAEQSKKNAPNPSRHTPKDTKLLVDKVPRATRNNICRNMAIAQNKQAQTLSTSVEKKIDQSSVNKRILTNVYASQQTRTARNTMARAMNDPKMGKNQSRGSTQSLAARLNKTKTGSYQNSYLNVKHEYVANVSYDGKGKADQGPQQVAMTNKVKRPNASGRIMSDKMLYSSYWEKTTDNNAADQQQVASQQSPDMAPVTASQMFSARKTRVGSMA